ncbi:helix-turn-helix domain-containing protein [Chloroflexota bacterium]
MLLTTSETSRILGISEVRLRRLLADKRFNAVKVGRDWLIDGEKLEYQKDPRGVKLRRKNVMYEYLNFRNMLRA